MQRKWNQSLTSIAYSDLVTDFGIEYDSTETCPTNDEMAQGDYNFKEELKQIYPPNDENPFHNIKETCYLTAIDDDLKKPFEKHSGMRFEAEYEICMRWGADRKFRAAKVIPFESNFLSVVRLLFKGRNWVLDCANFDGQYDYCGWLPTLSSRSVQSIAIKQHDNGLVTDSSYYCDSDDNTTAREAAGKAVNSSDTFYDLQSICTDPDLKIPQEPIDSSIYKIMDNTVTYTRDLEAYNTSAINDVVTDSLPAMISEEVNQKFSNVQNSLSPKISSSLDDLFFDLIELDQLFEKQVREIIQEDVSTSNIRLESIPTARSFSEDLIFASTENGISITSSKSETSLQETNSKSLLLHLLCLTGRKLKMQSMGGIMKNWLRIGK